MTKPSIPFQRLDVVGGYVFDGKHQARIPFALGSRRSFHMDEAVVVEGGHDRTELILTVPRCDQYESLSDGDVQGGRLDCHFYLG